MVGKIFKVVISRKAQKNLKKVNDYYEKSASTEVAKKVRTGLIKEAKALRKLPESRPLLQTTKKGKPPYRYTKKWSFKIIFQVFEKKDTVLVADFIHDKESPGKWDNIE